VRVDGHEQLTDEARKPPLQLAGGQQAFAVDVYSPSQRRVRPA